MAETLHSNHPRSFAGLQKGHSEKSPPHYSDLDPKSLQLFMDVWSSVKPNRKLLLLDELVSHLNSDTLVSYEEIGKRPIDADGDVRAAAIALLAELNDPKLVRQLVDIFLNDADLAPRMEAANLLGEFVLLGELEELDEDLKSQIEDAFITIIRSEDNPALRKRALESLGYSSRDEMPNIIETAFQREDPTWVASALRAMGRSHDNRWNDDVVSKLLDEDPRIRFAAAEAAGELAIQKPPPLSCCKCSKTKKRMTMLSPQPSGPSRRSAVKMRASTSSA